MTDTTVGHTALPWEIHQHNHRDGDLWLSIGHAGRGPIVDIGSRAEHEVAELKYLATPEEEQWANARLVVTAVNLHEELVEALQTVDEVWEDLTGKCDPDCDCIVHTIRELLARAEEGDTRG